MKEKLRKIINFLLGISEKYPEVEESSFSITVLIPAYNEENNIAETIASVKRQNCSIERILVIDDCSHDKTGEVAKKAGAEVVRTPKNSGTKAQAQNFALPLIDTDITVTIDADTTITEDTIKNVLPFFSDQKVASVCGFVIPQKIKTAWEKSRFIEYLWGIYVCKQAQNLWGSPLVSSGCFSAFNTKILKKFGGFPDRSMVEDMDLTWQQEEEGFKILLAPNAKCYPLDPDNWQTYRGQVERWIRGFLQNIFLHKTKIFKKKSLGMFVSWYLLDGLLMPLAIISLPILYMRFGLWILSIFLIDVLIISFASLKVAKREGKFWLALESIPWYYAIRPVNAYLFWKSLWKEWIIREKLTKWDKGH